MTSRIALEKNSGCASNARAKNKCKTARQVAPHWQTAQRVPAADVGRLQHAPVQSDDPAAHTRAEYQHKVELRNRPAAESMYRHADAEASAEVGAHARED